MGDVWRLACTRQTRGKNRPAEWVNLGPMGSGNDDRTGTRDHGGLSATGWDTIFRDIIPENNRIRGVEIESAKARTGAKK